MFSKYISNPTHYSDGDSGQSGRQTALRRPSLELQQIGPASGQRQRRPNGQNQTEALSADRCGKYKQTQNPPKPIKIKAKSPTNDCWHLSVIAFALPPTEFPSCGIGVLVEE